MIKINNLNKYYNKGSRNELHVLNDITIDLPDTGLVSFLGESGCGKTTLLNVIGGLDKQTAGTISYDDLTLEKYNPKLIDLFRRDNISYIFQNYLLLEDLTVYRNLELQLEIMGIMDKDEVSNRITYTLKAVGMYKYRKKLAGALSGGEQQRVAIARALLKNAKIILADEPTGNLDKKNSIEVMNILKKISEKTLVLLVTHNKELADFYSDSIILLKDGKITGNREASLNSLNHSTDDTIYLGDLEKETVNTNDFNFTIYKDSSTKAQIRLINKNGKIYIDSNLPVELIDNHIKLVEGNFHELEKDSITDFNYDTSWYNNEIKNEKESFLKIFTYSIKNLFRSGKKSKLFNILFVFIGVLLSITTILFANSINVTDKRSYLDNKYIVDYSKTDRYNLNETLKEAYEKNYISHFVNFGMGDLGISKNNSILNNLYYRENVEALPFSYLEGENIILGNQPKIGEIAITNGVAEEIKKSLKLNSLEEILGLRASNSNYDINLDYVTITGITANRGKAYYTSPNSGQFSYSEVANQTMFNYFSKDGFSYEVVEGRDLANANEILAFNNGTLDLNQTITLRGNNRNITYTVVGLVKPTNGIRRAIIFNTKAEAMLQASQSFNYLPQSLAPYDIVEGRDLANDEECLVSELANLEIGVSYQGYKVVGKYRAPRSIYGSASILSDKDYNYRIASNGDLYYLGFSIDNMSEFRNLVGDIPFGTLENIYHDQFRRDKIEDSIVYIVVSLVLIVISILYVYFIMRSKLISSIYPTAVIRNIGGTKKYIYRRFLIELLAITLFTNLLGYLGMYAIYYGFVYTTSATLNISIFATNIGIFLAGIALIFIINFTIGVLPIRRYLKATPSEVASKYDI